MRYDPTRDDVTDILLVGGTDESYKAPENFEEAWNNKNPYLTDKWREAIQKEFENMEKNNVWKVMSKQKVPSDRRLLGTKWVFKVKKNRVFKARLVTQGYAQIPGINHKDNFSPVIYKTTFRLILVLWATYNWEAEIIDIETAFLYGDLEKEIYLRIPEGYREYSARYLDGEACLLLDHTIYRLVQAAHQFFKKLVEVLVKK